MKKLEDSRRIHEGFARDSSGIHVPFGGFVMKMHGSRLGFRRIQARPLNPFIILKKGKTKKNVKKWENEEKHQPGSDGHVGEAPEPV